MKKFIKEILKFKIFQNALQETDNMINLKIKPNSPLFERVKAAIPSACTATFLMMSSIKFHKPMISRNGWSYKIRKNFEMSPNIQRSLDLYFDRVETVKRRKLKANMKTMQVNQREHISNR